MRAPLTGSSKLACLGTDAIRRVGALGRVLGIWAHPDDETYLSGGLMAAAAGNGQPTMCIRATGGNTSRPTAAGGLRHSSHGDGGASATEPSRFSGSAVIAALGRTGWREWFRRETFVGSVDCSSPISLDDDGWDGLTWT